jgi:hypothetical protein
MYVFATAFGFAITRGRARRVEPDLLTTTATRDDG